MVKLDSISKLMNDTWALYKQRGAVLTQIFIIPAVFLVILQLLAARGTDQALGLMPIVYLVVIVVSIIASVAIVSAVGRGTNFEASYRTGFSLFWPAVLLAIIRTLTIIGGFALFIVPGIIFTVWFMFVIYALVLEGKRGMAAMLQSKAYAKDYWWAILGRVLVLLVLVWLVMIAIFAPVAAIAGRMVAAVVYGILIIFVAPIALCYTYKIYDNLVRLKPNVAELAAKETKALVVTFMVIGIIAIIVGIALAGVAIALLAKYAMEHGGQLPSSVPGPGFMRPYGFPSSTVPGTGSVPGPNVY